MLPSDRLRQIDAASASLYEAAIGLVPWRTALDMCATACGADAAILFSKDLGLDPRVPTETSAIDLNVAADFLKYHKHLDPWTQALSSQRGYAKKATGLFLGERLITDRDLQKTIGYNEYYKKQDLRRLISIGVEARNVDDAPDLILSLLRRVRSPEYEGDDALATAHMRSHFDAAINLHLRVRERSLASAEALFGGEGSAIALLGLEKLILYANEKFRLLIRSSPAIRIEGGFLKFVGSAQPVELACNRILTADGMIAGKPQFFPVGPAPGSIQARYMVIAPLPARIAEVLNLGPKLVIAKLADLPTSSGKAADAAATAFGLSGAERRILHHLVAGRGVEEIAARTGVAPGTVRIQMKAIYAKAGIHRQAELVSHVLTNFDPSLRILL